jgi:hypothetical protein
VIFYQKHILLQEIGELLSRILEMGRELEEKKSELEEAVNRCQTVNHY